MSNGNGPPVTTGRINLEVAPTGLAKANISRDQRSFPIRFAVVTRVDPKKMVVDLKPLSGGGSPSSNIPITFPAAGARHFIGAMPEVGDMCVVGYAPTESGAGQRPVVLGWYVPSTQSGYDWLNVRSHSPAELGLTAKEKIALEGVASERRHKLRQMEKGNVVASSSQGADLLLTESATLANRRGNEVILRDQDQALIVRSLQQFHAGAGFRTYSGMIQRDANLLPTQLVETAIDYCSTRQVDEAGVPLPILGLDATENAGSIRANTVYDGTDFAADVNFDPAQILRRGLFVDGDGVMTLGGASGTTYGGKPMYRVSVDKMSNSAKHMNGITNTGAGVFTEYRIEVAHTSDGTLPVTEQTDGIDIDRFLPNVPNQDPEGSGGPAGGTLDPLNMSPASPLVEFVLGTAVGNDPFNYPDQYGVPLVAKITTESGKRQTSLRAATPDDPLSSQLAFLIRSRDPSDPTKESFIALSKGGAWLTNFQGSGSMTTQEDLRTGKISFYGLGPDGESRRMEATGSVTIANTGVGRSKDNVGIDIRSAGGAVEIFGGGATTAGAASADKDNPNATPAGSKTALSLISAQSAILSAKDRVKVTAKEVAIEDASVVGIRASSTLEMSIGDSITMAAKKIGVTIAGKAEYTYGGPLDSDSTNGESRSTSFTATPASGGIGGTVDKYEITYGDLKETFTSGRRTTVCTVGHFGVFTMGTAPTSTGPGSGFTVSTGATGADNKIDAGLTAIDVIANAGSASLKATKGATTVSGTTGATLKSQAKVTLQATYVSVTQAPGPKGGVLTDGCTDPLTGVTFLAAGSVGCSGFRVA